jgi:hypothetical protein
MDRNTLPYPLQMRNGGSLPAHLPSSTATPLDPLRWLAPPQRAPEPQPSVRQMRNGGLPPVYLPYSPHPDPVAAIANPKAIVSDAIARARQEDAAAHARVSDAIARARQEAARCIQLLDEQAARARQEATRRQKLLDKHAACARMSDAIARARQEAAAARARPEAARRQQLLDDKKEDGLLYATRLFAQCVAEDHVAGLLFAKRLFVRCVDTDQLSAERSAQERNRAAARTIFLWLCRRRLHIRLARQTSR